MDRSRPARRALPAITLATIVAGLLPAAPAVQASAVPTSISFLDRVGGSAEYRENQSVTIWPVTTRSFLSLSFGFEGPVNDRIDIDFSAAVGEELTVGSYPDVAEVTEITDGPKLGLYSQRASCRGGPISATIEELTWSDSSPTSLAMSILCDENGSEVAIDLRWNATTPVAAGAWTGSGGFGQTLAGTAATPRVLTLTSLGTESLTLGAAVVTGTDAADFPIVADGCVGLALAAGATCTITIGYEPIDGPLLTRFARLEVPDNSSLNVRSLPLVGSVKRPTTITIVSAYNPGVLGTATTPTFTATVSPSPGSGEVRWSLNGVASAFSIPLGTPYQPSLMGTYTVRATFLGTTSYAPSTSNTLEQTAYESTSIVLAAFPAPGFPVGVYQLTAYVQFAANVQPPGGVFTVVDETTGTTLLDSSTRLTPGWISFAGHHDLHASYSGAEPIAAASTADATVDGPPATVPDPPWAVTAVPSGANAIVSWSAPIWTGGHDITGYTVTASPGGTTCTQTLAASCAIPGLDPTLTYTFTVTATNDLGTSLPSAPSADFVLDATPPVATAPSWVLRSGVGLDVGRPKLRLQGSGSDVGSGVDHVEIAQSTDGGSWITVATQGAPWSLDRLVSVGHTYRFRVRAFDAAGNVGAWAYGPTSRISAVADGSSVVRYGGRWTVPTSTAYWGGSTHASSTAGSTASIAFSGRSIGWVGVKARTRGRARIYLDGGYRGTIDLWSATTLAKHVLWQTTFATAGKHTLVIKVVGTSGRPRIDVDGFIVGS